MTDKKFHDRQSSQRAGGHDRPPAPSICQSLYLPSFVFASLCICQSLYLPAFCTCQPLYLPAFSSAGPFIGRSFCMRSFSFPAHILFPVPSDLRPEQADNPVRSPGPESCHSSGEGIRSVTDRRARARHPVRGSIPLTGGRPCRRAGRPRSGWG